MKVTNISSGTLYLRDLKITKEAQTQGRRGEEQYLGAGQSVYLPNTSEVLRSAHSGDLSGFKARGLVTLEDQVTLAASGGADSVVLTHGFGFAPVVYVLKQVGPNWVDATGTIDITHNSAFTTVTVANVLVVSQTLMIRLA